jgi:rod shape-determining protein MreC
MNLKSTNADILKRMSALEQEALGYRRTIELLNDSLREKGITFATNEDVHYRIMPARVVNNSVNKEDNYITLNKGSLDGFKPDMGVFTPKGVVGVIMSVSPHFSIVIPVLHHKYHLSCKIKDSNYFGSLTWEGGDPENTLLTGLPSHATFNPGDTILTNGYSPVFPEGIPVGVVEGALNRKTGENKSLKVKLFTDFSKLSEVMVIENIFKDEQLNLEKGVQK